MTEIIRAVILGLVQGITEFLPVSSSGHLVIVGDLLGETTEGIARRGPEWVVCLHLATAAATILVFRGQIRDLAAGFLAGARCAIREGSVREAWRREPHFSETLLLVLSAVPVGVVGFLFRSGLEALTRDALVAGLALLVTGTLLWLTRYRRHLEEGHRVSFAEAVVMGIAQAAAIIPGISRSGATLSCGLLCRERSRYAVRFSFLMAVLPILAATALKARQIDADGANVSLAALGVGFLVALGTGYVALKWLIGLVRHHHLHRFAWYCWAAGVAVVAWKLGALLRQ